MKSHRLLLLAAFLLPGSAQAQLSEVPERISYQGIITDADGTPIGDTAPENRTVIFRIWDHQTAAAEENLVYSEEQVATIANGEFSVLVGAGADVVSNPLDFDPSEANKGPGTINIANVFDGNQRYLGVTVDDGDAGTVDPEISPRQQIVTSPFSFRAREAETVIDSGIVTGAIGDQQVTLSKMATASVDSSKIVDSSIATDDLAGAAVTLDKMADGSVDLNKLVAAVKEALCPPGSIMAFAGTDVPDGWLLCDGSPVSSTQYGKLHAAIGTSWGDGGDGTGIYFNLPDLRGMFLRGVNGLLDDPSWEDPEAGERVARNGGNSGNAVGSVQSDEFKSHDHVMHGQGTIAPYGQYFSRDIDKRYAGGGGSDEFGSDSAPDESLRTGFTGVSTETRPQNAYVNYIIKY